MKRKTVVSAPALPARNEMASSERKLFHWALKPKVRVTDSFPLHPLDGFRTCFYVTVHVQTVYSLGCMFDVKPYQLFITCNTHTRKDPKGFTTKALMVFLHDLKLVTLTLHLVIQLLWHNWYFCLSLSFSPFSQLGDSIG